MGKEQKSNREGKTKATLSPKEKKAVKKSKKEGRPFLGIEKIR